jgi:hypothetical protein
MTTAFLSFTIDRGVSCVDFRWVFGMGNRNRADTWPLNRVGRRLRVKGGPTGRPAD